MTFRLRVETEPGQWLKEADLADAKILKAANLALRDLGLKARDAGRAAISNAGFSRTWANSIVLIMFPRGSAPSVNPVAYLHSKINYSDIFETGRGITGSPFIWLPLPAVPPMLGSGISKFGGVIARPHMTPSQFVRFVGPLVTMRRPGRLPMLGTPVAGGRGKTTRATQGRVRRSGARIAGGAKNVELVPMYVGVHSVNIPAKFDALGAMEKAGSEASLAQFYLDELQKLETSK